MEKFLIEGGHRLEGRVRPSGSKNEVLPVLAATLVSDQTITLENVPRIADVLVMIEILQALGARAEWVGANTLEVNAGGVTTTVMPADLCRRLRASILLAGPMLGRFGAGSCTSGRRRHRRRRLDTHFLGFQALGARVEMNGDFTIRAEKLTGADFFLDEPSVTGSENIIMAAVLAEERTVLSIACSRTCRGSATCSTASVPTSRASAPTASPSRG